MLLLFRNALKGLRKKKVQMLGIIVMITLSTGIYVAMNTALDRLEDRYYTYLEEQNVENYSVDIVLNYENDISKETLEDLENSHFQKATESEKQILFQYKTWLQTKPPMEENLKNAITMVFNKYGADAYLQSQKLTSFTEQYGFSYEYQRSKLMMNKEDMIKVMPYQQDKKMNKTYLVEGEFPANDHEITMLPQYAKKHHLEIGDTYKIGEVEYKIVGFAYASDYIYPLISFSSPIFDEEKNNIIFMTEANYQEVNGIDDNTFSLRFPETNRKFELKTEVTDDGVSVLLSDDNFEKLLKEQGDTVVASASTITRLARIAALQLEFATNRLFADYFLYLLLAISVVIIMIITKKRIDDERLQIGVLKSLGYSKYSIAFSYLVYPILGSVIGGVLGFAIGSFVHEPLTKLFLSFYNVPISNFHLDLAYLKTSVIVPAIALSILCYLIAILMLRKKPLALLKEGSNLKVNIFSRFVNWLTRLLPFNLRFKYSLAARSLGKLFIVTLTSFATGLLIVLTLIGMNLFNSMIDTSFEGIHFDYQISMKTLTMTEQDKEADFALYMNSDVVKLTAKNGDDIKIEDEDLSISVSGIDQNGQYLEVLDDKKRDIRDLLIDDDAMIITANMKEYLHLEIGDSVTLNINNQEFTYRVAGISNEYMSFMVYVDREELSKKLGLPTPAYTMMYSSNTKYADMSSLSNEELQNIGNILSTKDLRANIEKQMERYNASIYIIIAFASVMAFAIIAVIANIVVEENKKTISLMKVMGYSNKKVSSIVLNIYTPFVVIAYLLSIPAMISFLKWIVKQLVGDMQITIPITLSPWMATLGLIGLLVAYYIAIAMSKRVLNKVPLAVALKRE